MEPDSVEVQTNLGLLYIYQNRFAAAETLFGDVLRDTPDIPEANTNLGIIYGHQWRIADAIAAHKNAGALAEARNNLGVAYCQDGQVDVAIAEFNAAIEAGGLEAARANLSIVTADSENVDVTSLQTAPVGIPIGVPAAWCEIVD